MKKSVSAVIILLQFILCRAQPHNWQNLDLGDDSVFGISAEKAYSTLLANKKSVPVIVAVIDSGIDTAQEDLKQVLWLNPVNGSHGKNYLGYEIGREDVTNLASLKKDFYDSLSYSLIPETYRADYQTYRKTAKEYESHVQGMQSLVTKLTEASTALQAILAKIGKENPGLTDFESYSTKSNIEAFVAKLIVNKLPHYRDFADLKKHELDGLLELAQYHLDHGLNIRETGSETEQHKTNNSNNIQNDALGLIPDQNYTSYHGTHVAGIIAAKRNNGIGANGIVDHVQIMMLKVINNIRELRDENLADAIRYAVDHGAKIINLSFGKPYTWNKKAVDEAVRYAMEKDVLIIHAAGNAGEDLDKQEHYPNPTYLDGKGRADAWIEVGASGWKNDSTLVPSFSNYGKLSVDVFAPGVQIYSTLPFNQYAALDGTSMAAPVVTGLATMIRQYYPYLNASKVKRIIMNSVVKVSHNIKVTDRNEHTKMLPFSAICTSAGIVNAFNAIKLAETYK